LKLLWITHRRKSELSATTRLGVSSALCSRGWTIEFMSPDGDFPVNRSKRLGRGHRSFNQSVSTTLNSIKLDSFSVAIVEWTGVEGAVGPLRNAGLPWVIMDRSPPVATGIIGWFQRKQYEKAWKIARSSGAGRAVKSAYMATTQSWDKASVVVPAGVNISEFEIASMNNKPLVVYHGSLDRSRELHRLAMMDVNLLLFGEGNDSQRLDNLTQVKGRGEVASRLAGADIGVLHLPNREVWRHASPLKVAEYAASGLPVVSSEVSGLEEYRNSEWITLIPLGDDGACEAALQRLSALSIEERQRLGTLAREEAERSMTWEQCTESLHEMLLGVKR